MFLRRSGECASSPLTMGGIALLILVTTTIAKGSDAPGQRHQPDSSVPRWAREAVWYQIFPERFRNGDPTNDPGRGDMVGAWPYHVPPEWRVSPWTSDWYSLQPWEAADTLGFYYHVQQRRYGGDLQGVIDKLDYLSALGVNAIYLNPIFESPSLHKYDASMYHHVDNNFGPDPEGDRAIWSSEDPADPRTWRWTSADTLFLGLVRRAHTRGMHVIIDGVFNHVGTTFWAFQEVRKKGAASAFKDWFTIQKWEDPSTPQDEFSYKGWNDVRDLPEIRETDSGLVAGPREHIKAIVRRWMDPNGDGDPSDGVDGWRLDVAEMVALPFWREFRRWAREVNPDSYITGEIWWEDWNRNLMYNAAPWLRGDAFDGVMNYRLARELCHFFIDKKNRISPSEFDRRLRTIRDDYGPDATAVLMNLVGSHDVDRIGSMIVNEDEAYDHRASAKDNPAYDVRKPNAQERQIQKLMVLFQMTYPGAPMIYYGDEAGMWGGDDPDNRKPMLWADMPYAPECAHPLGVRRPEDPNGFDEDLFAYYRAVIALRRSIPALVGGSFEALVADDSADVFGFLRVTSRSVAAVIFNAGTTVRTVGLPEMAGLSVRKWKLLFPGERSGSVVTSVVSVPGTSGVVLQATMQ
ncbi:MAG: glycoside hydrolase family 13 protein [Bacteroidota bacterium]